MSRSMLLRIGLGVCLTLLLALAIAVSAWAYIATAPAARSLAQGEGTPTATLFSPLPTPTATETMTSTGNGLETIGALPDLRLPSVRGFNVSEQTGAATLDYPLTLPPGPGGFAPRLSISYSSAAVDDIQGENQRGDNIRQSGILGLGWSLTGIPTQSISDWEVRGGDRRARMIHISGIGPSGSVEFRRNSGWSDDWYQSPASNFIIAGGDQLYGTTHISVKDENGTYYDFDPPGGDDPHTSSCYTIGSNGECNEVWGTLYVERISHVWGQEIEFHYIKTQQRVAEYGSTYYTRDVRPDYITYGDPANPVKIDFVYFEGEVDQAMLCYYNNAWRRCDRGRANNGLEYQDQWTDGLLKQIDISVGSTMVRRYAFSYYTTSQGWHDDSIEPKHRYYEFTQEGYFTATIQSHHSILKEIRELICQGSVDNPTCTDPNTPYRFYYQQLRYREGRDVNSNCPEETSPDPTGNDIFLIRADNGYQGAVEFTYYNGYYTQGNHGCGAYHIWWAHENDRGWHFNDLNDRASRWRFLIKRKRVFDGMGNYYDVEYDYNLDSPYFNGLGFVDYTEGGRNIEAGFKYLGFPYVRITTFDFGGQALRTEEKSFYFELEVIGYDGGGNPYLDCVRDDPRQGLVKQLIIRQGDENGPILSQTDNVYHFSLLPNSDPSNPTNWDKCQMRKDRDTYQPNPNFVKEPHALLVSTTTTTFTFENGSSPVTRTVRTAYEYAWDFTQTGHQSPGNYGALLRTLEYGLDPNPSGYPPDERTTIIYYAHSEPWHILNKVRQRCVISGIWPRDTQRWCQAGDPNTYYYYDGLGYGEVGDRGALTMTRVDIAAGVSVETRQDYDPYGNVIRTWDANKSATNDPNPSIIWTYDSVFHALPKTETNALGQTTTVTYDSDPDSGVSTRWGVPISVDGPNPGIADRVEYRYDNQARLWKVIKPGDTPDLPTQQYNYNINHPYFGAPLAVETLTRINAVPDINQYDKSVDFYDGLGQKLQTQTWTGEGGPPWVGVVMATRYDALGRATLAYKPYRTTDPPYNNSFGQFTPPPPNQPVAITTYDALGRVTQVTNWEGVPIVRTVYQEGGFKVKTLDARGVMHATWRDGLGRQIQTNECQITLPDPNTLCPWSPTNYVQSTYYRYDVLDNLTTVTDTLGHVTTITYDLAGRKTAITDPDMGTWSYEYDPNGNLTHQTDARGQHLCFRYDPLNRLSAKGLGTPTSCNLFAWYGYDEAGHGAGAIGQRTSLYSFTRTQPNTDPVRTDWYYDERGRVVSQTHQLWGNVYTLHFTYTPSDRVATVTYPDGEVVTQSYSNQRGLPTRLTSSLATYVDSASYTFYAKLERLTLGNRLQTSYTYDALFRLASLQTGASLQRLTYSYDVSDNVVGMVDTALSPAETHSFSYDALNRLATAVASTSSEGGAQPYAHSYAYDALGNIDYVIRDGTRCDYRYGSRPHAVIEVSCEGGQQASYQYDANGNLTTRTQGGVTYQQQYDAENRLILVTRTQGTSLQVTRFYYDAEGNRVRQVAPDGTSTIYLGQWYEESQSVSRSRVRTNYYYLGGQRVALRQGAVGQAGLVYWLHGDHLGSTSEVSTATGSLYGRERYYPYGQVRYTWGSLPTTYNYTGQRLDYTGLLYYGARYYDPALMRFTQPDTLVQMGPRNPTPYLPLTVSYTEPRLLEQWNQLQRSRLYPSTQASQPPPAVDPQSLNRYTYARNSPLAYIDSSGHIAWWIVGGVVGGIAGFGAYALTHQDNFDWGQAALWTAGGAVVGASFGAGAQWVAGALRTEAAVPAVTAATTAGAAASSPAGQQIITVGTRVLQLSQYALQRMSERGVSIEQVQKIVNTAQSFRYFHDGAWKTGYYDPVSKIFVAEVEGVITTVIAKVNPQYIENLKSLCYEVTYDPAADTVYIYLKNSIGPGDIAATYPLGPVEEVGQINLDFDVAGRLIGIEILDARPCLQNAVE